MRSQRLAAASLRAQRPAQPRLPRTAGTARGQRRGRSQRSYSSLAAAAQQPDARVPPIPGLGAPHPLHGVVASPSEHPRAPSVELSPPLSGAVAHAAGRLPSERYAAMIEAGVLEADPAQQAIVEGSLDALCEQLHTHQGHMEAYVGEFASWAELRVAAELAEHERRKHTQPTRLDLLKGRLRKFSGNSDGEPSPEELSNEHYGLDEPPPVPQAPRGMYLYGGVGTGKSLLMDILYAATGDVVRHRRRVHFHTFLLEVHARLHVHATARHASGAKRTIRENEREWEIDEASQGGTAAWEHPMAAVAREVIAARGHSLQREDAAAGGPRLAGGAKSKSWLPQEENALLLCFDEFQLNEVGDALIVRSLLSHLFKMGVVVVITSNRTPQEVNRNAAGWQAVDYEHFLETLNTHTSTIKLDAGKDYRRAHTENDSDPVQTVFSAADDTSAALDEATAELHTLFLETVAKEGGDTAVVAPVTVPVMFGRQLEVSKAGAGVAWLSFDEICAGAVGTPDFVAVASNFHTVFVSGVPQLSLDRRDLARRFITLVDELYNRGGRLYCSASVPIEDLFRPEGGGYTPEQYLAMAEQFQFEAEAIQDGQRRPIRELEAASLGIAADNRTEQLSAFTVDDDNGITDPSTPGGFKVGPVNVAP